MPDTMFTQVVPAEPETYYSIAEFAKRRRVCYATVQKWIAHGMPHFRTAVTTGKFQIPERAAERWLADLVVSSSRPSASRPNLRVSVMSYSHNSQGPSDPPKSSFAAKLPQPKVVPIAPRKSTNLPKTSV